MKIKRENIQVAAVIASGIAGFVWGFYDSYRYRKMKRRAEEAEREAAKYKFIVDELKYEHQDLWGEIRTLEEDETL